MFKRRKSKHPISSVWKASKLKIKLHINH